MDKIYSNKSIVFLGFIFIFSLFFVLMSSPVMASAGSTAKELPDTITVTPEATKDEFVPEAKLNLRNLSLVKGKEYTLKVYNLTDDQTVTFKSDDEAIVSADDSGVILGVDFGTTVVTAIVKEGSKVVTKLTCDVTVGPAAVSVKFAKSEYDLVVGKKLTLKTILEPFNTVEEAKYISLDPSIATVSAGGRVTAKSPGIVTIYVLVDQDNENLIDICTINVIEEDTYEINDSETVVNDATGEESKSDGALKE